MSEKKPTDKHYSAIFESEVPSDLFFMIILLTIGIVTIYLPILNATPLRYALPLPLLFFIPGYCIVAAVFPKEGDIDLLERVALSIGISLAVVILIGLTLNFTPWGIRLEPVVIFISLFTLIIILIAHYRRALSPAEKRLRIQVFPTVRSAREGIFPSGQKRIDHLLNIGLALVITIAIIITVFVILAPKEGERFSEFYVLSEKHTLSDYPQRIFPGTYYPLYIGIGNQEHRNVTYTIETWTLQTEFDPLTNTSHILVMDRGEQMTVSLGHNETRLNLYNLMVRKSGYDRVEFLLFNETVPGPEVTGSDRINASYHNLHFWITSK